MSYNKIIPFLLISFTVLNPKNSAAQPLNINGDTIFVNMEAEIQIVFPAHPMNFKTEPANTTYRIWNAGTSINVIAGSENSAPATLLVSEAERNHRFILMYKQDITNAEAKLYYDFATVKKLEQHIREKGFTRPEMPVTTAVKTGQAKPEIKAITKAATAEKPVEDAYTALLTQAEKDFKLQNYQEAAASFNDAHLFRPKEKIPVKRLEEIKDRLAQKDKLVQQEIERKYVALSVEARSYMKQKDYLKAGETYKRALELKPGDPFSTHQLQKIDGLATEISAKSEASGNTNLPDKSTTQAEITQDQEKLLLENKYNDAVKAGDNFFNAGDYDNANLEYTKALGFIKRDWPEKQIIKIDEIQHELIAQANAKKQKPAQQQNVLPVSKPKNDSIALAAELKKKYNLALSNGKSALVKNDLISAKTFYEEALNLEPLQQEPKNQLSIINDKLEALAKEAEINEKYERVISLADSLSIVKAYEAAIVSYREALSIKPTETYPVKSIKYMQSELGRVEKKKKEDTERRYSDLLTLADKAVADKQFDNAKSLYTEVLSIHADNDYAKRRLEIISYQLEKTRLEKLREDSAKQVVPVKKLKKKRSS